VSEGARLRSREQFKPEAQRLFASFGIIPLQIEERGDGEARFVFVNDPDKLLLMMEAIPKEWWAISAVVTSQRSDDEDA
jgi:hypothetical protein